MKTNLREALFSTRGHDKYSTVLQNAQAHISKILPKRIEEISEKELTDIIVKYITDNGIKCEITDSVTELAQYIYHDMAGYSFITREKLFEINGFEELNINSWDNVHIRINGETIKTDYRFLSPEQAIDIHQRMLRKTGTVLDEAMPRAIADIGDSIRICVEKYPIVDKEVGIASSIRKVSLNVVSKELIVQRETVTQEILDFLILCLRYGVSMCISGETGAGKTTLAGGLLSILAEKIRIITIEEGSREWDFIKRDEDGYAVNNVIHLKTRFSDDEKFNIDQEVLVKDSLRLDPECIAPGEVRGREAFEVMGVSNTGHTVVTTIHSNGAKDTPERLITLAKKAYDMSDNTLYSMAARAFPILVHTEIFGDKKRRVTQIYEVLGYRNGEMMYNPLFEYEVTDNIYNGDVIVEVIGNFIKRNSISKTLMQRMLKKGARRSDILKFYDEEGGKADG